MKKEKTISKTIRIPESVYNKIMDEAKRTNSDFCKVANYRLKHFGGGLTPDVTARVANMLDMPDTVYNHLLCTADDAGMSVESYILQMAVYGCIESDDKMNNTLEERKEYFMICS